MCRAVKLDVSETKLLAEQSKILLTLKFIILLCDISIFCQECFVIYVYIDNISK